MRLLRLSSCPVLRRNIINTAYSPSVRNARQHWAINHKRRNVSRTHRMSAEEPSLPWALICRNALFTDISMTMKSATTNTRQWYYRQAWRNRLSTGYLWYRRYRVSGRWRQLPKGLPLARWRDESASDDKEHRGMYRRDQRYYLKW